MYSRVDSDPKFHADQLAKAFERMYRDGEADRKHREWMRTRPAARMYDMMYRGFHGIGINPFHAIESPVASEAELRQMARISDETGGPQ